MPSRGGFRWLAWQGRQGSKDNPKGNHGAEKSSQALLWKGYEETMEQMIQGKSRATWQQEYPILADMTALRETFWRNPRKISTQEALAQCPITPEQVADAEARLQRFAPYIAQAFPETAAQGGIIESPVRPIPQMQQALGREGGLTIPGSMLLKCDSHLPISGSIKARGGIYEVLKHAEDIAIQAGKLSVTEDYSLLNSDEMREFYSQYSIAVGSTGNLGLSIGIMSAKLGFRVTVHMSADARQWKKDLLRSKGVTVVEYPDDYSKAVKEGRRMAEEDPKCYFVDDENSVNLFLGYAVAARRLQRQLAEQGVTVDEEHPLIAFLPCGVGGGPGGVAFGLKLVYGDAVHCFFAEPTHAPCMMLGLVTGLQDQVCVQDFGIDNRTAADGLAVGRPSSFVGKTIQPFLSGSYTISDEKMYHYLAMLADAEAIWLEPSALAGMAGPLWLLGSWQGQEYLKDNGLAGKENQITWMPWATGGNMVPPEIMQEYYQAGKAHIG